MFYYLTNFIEDMPFWNIGYMNKVFLKENVNVN